MKSPTGKFSLGFDFSKLSNASGGKFEVTDGRLSVPKASNSTADGFSATGVCFGGVLGVSSPEIQGTPKFEVRAPLSVTNVSMTMRPGQEPELQGDWAFTVPRNLVVPFETPGKDEDGVRYFAISLKTTLTQDFTLAGRIVFSGRRVVIPETSSVAKVNLEVLRGNGEHENQEHGRTNGDEAPNQELATRFESSARCRWHIYLKPRSYNADVKVKLRFDDVGLIVGVDDIHTEDGSLADEGWDKVGCSELAQAVVCTAALGAVLGPANAAALCGGGAIGGNIYINHRIKAGIQSKVNDFNREWPIIKR